MLEICLINPIARQYVVVIAVNLCMLSAGMNFVWSSPVLVKLRNETETVLSRPITEKEASWIVSVTWLTMTFGNLIVMYLMDQIGRKFCLLFSCSSRVVVTLMLTFSNEYWMMLLARTISGISDVFALTVVATYATEVASKEVRGALGTILQLSSSAGVVIMFSVGPFVSYFALNLIYTGIAVAVFIPIWFVPDSPYILYAKGRVDEATKLLTYLRGSEMLAKEEIKEYASVNTHEKLNKKALLKDKIFLKSMILVIILGVGVQLVGFNAVSFYLQTILESTNTSVRPEIASVIIGLIQLFAAFCATLTTDRFGRKPVMISTLIGMSLGMVALGYFFYVQTEGEAVQGAMNFLPLVSMILVVFCYSNGIGCIIWLLVPELLDGPTRSIGVAVSQVMCSFFGFLTTKYFALIAIATGPSVTYWFFSISCVVMLTFVAIFIPETKGKTFAEIQRDLSGQKSVLALESSI